jgi:hypothetical protein
VESRGNRTGHRRPVAWMVAFCWPFRKQSSRWGYSLQLRPRS